MDSLPDVLFEQGRSALSPPALPPETLGPVRDGRLVDRGSCTNPISAIPWKWLGRAAQPESLPPVNW